MLELGISFSNLRYDVEIYDIYKIKLHGISTAFLAGNIPYIYLTVCTLASDKKLNTFSTTYIEPRKYK